MIELDMIGHLIQLKEPMELHMVEYQKELMNLTIEQIMTIDK